MHAGCKSIVPFDWWTVTFHLEIIIVFAYLLWLYCREPCLCLCICVDVPVTLQMELLSYLRLKDSCPNSPSSESSLYVFIIHHMLVDCAHIWVALLRNLQQWGNGQVCLPGKMGDSLGTKDFLNDSSTSMGKYINPVLLRMHNGEASPSRNAWRDDTPLSREGDNEEADPYKADHN